MRRLLATATVLAGFALAGCAQSPGLGGQPQSGGDAAFVARAQQVAANWTPAARDAWKAGFVPLGDLTIVPPDGFPDGATKMSALNGWYQLDITLPAPGNADGVVVFPDGDKISVPVISADQAYRSLATGSKPTCSATDDCGYLTVTGATLTTATLRTSRGPATVPAWSFSVREMKDPMVRVAVAPRAISPVPQMTSTPWQPTAPVVSAQDLTAIDGDRIDYRLGVGACDKQIRPLFWESDSVVVIGGTVTPPGGGQVCVAMLKFQPVSVQLSRPVGDRIIVDAVTGQAVLPALRP